MPSSRLAFVVWLALCLLPVPSWATSPGPRIGLELTAFPDGGITLTSGRFETRVAYRVRVINSGHKAVKGAVFSANTSVQGADTNTSLIDPAPIAVSGVAAVCTQPGGPTSIECSLGAGGYLQAGSSAEFWVVVRTPNAGQAMAFAGVFEADAGKRRGRGHDLRRGRGHGQGHDDDCCEVAVTVHTPLIDPVLATTDPDASFKKQASSFVGAEGGTLFTGVSGFPTKDDPWTTTVSVPEVTTGVFGLPFTTAAVVESEDLNSCVSINLQCNRTQLTIPGTFDSLLITLRQHPSILSKYARIEHWRISYSADPGNVPYTELQRCGIVGGPALGVPCIEACREYPPESTGHHHHRYGSHHGSYGPGVFECKIRALDNGGYKVQ
jgi:hypothetical protein